MQRLQIIHEKERSLSSLAYIIKKKCICIYYRIIHSNRVKLIRFYHNISIRFRLTLVRINIALIKQKKKNKKQITSLGPYFGSRSPYSRSAGRETCVYLLLSGLTWIYVSDVCNGKTKKKNKIVIIVITNGNNYTASDGEKRPRKWCVSTRRPRYTCVFDKSVCGGRGGVVSLSLSVFCLNTVNTHTILLLL